VPCAVVQFQVCIQNRYKLNKKYRKFSPLPSNADECDTSLETKTLAVQAKVCVTLMLDNRKISLIIEFV